MTDWGEIGRMYFEHKETCRGFSGPCGKYPVQKYRQMTQYVDEEDNYKVLCKDCQTESNEYWSGMWQDYYSGRL